MDNNLPNIVKWAELYRYYRETDRGGMIKSLRINTPLFYYPTLTIYMILGIIQMWLILKNGLWFFLLIPYLIIFYFFSNYGILKYYKSYANKYEIKSHPYFNRIELLHYILFSEKLSTSKKILKNDVSNLIKWNEKANNNISISFFNAPIVLVVLTVFFGALLKYMELEKYLNKNTIVIMIFIVFFGLWLSWSIFDLSKINENINENVSKFLKRWEIEN